jgi:8-amino-7-oxononanoate synthase
VEDVKMLRTSSRLESRIEARLKTLAADGLLRSLVEPTGIDLCSNDYLGLANHPSLKARMSAAVLEMGCGSTGSRLLRGQRRCFSDIEQRFARFKGTEAALYFSSGYAANLAVLSSFLEEGDVVFFDRLNHASLIDGMKLGAAKKAIFPHADLEKLMHYVELHHNRGQMFLVTESLFSMDGDFAPLQEYATLSKNTGMALIIDEAHAVGIYGERGTGAIESAGVSEDVFLSINSAGKALGVSGAFVAGAFQAIDYLLQRGRTFIFSTAPPPSVAAAIDAALDIIEQEPERRRRLQQLAAYLRGALSGFGSNLGVDVAADGSQILSVVVGDSLRALRAASRVQMEGFDVRAIRPPTVPEGTARLRISVNIGLSEETLYRFASCLRKALAAEGVQ